MHHISKGGLTWAPVSPPCLRACSALCVWKQCIVRLEAVHCACGGSALCVWRQCIVRLEAVHCACGGSALCVWRQCIVRLEAVHCASGGSALYVWRQCIVCVEAVHCVSGGSALYVWRQCIVCLEAVDCISSLTCWLFLSSHVLHRETMPGASWWHRCLSSSVLGKIFQQLDKYNMETRWCWHAASGGEGLRVWWVERWEPRLPRFRVEKLS